MSKFTFNLFLNLLGALSKNPRLQLVSKYTMRAFANLTMLVKRARRANDLEQLGNEWQRMFPSKKFVPITHHDENKVYAQILGKCPVTASGDLSACHRLMEYDRHILKKIGGEFEVLQSKADPNIEVCLVAMTLSKK
ncbi:MAG: hypothetical protein HOE90_09990 [Bacteriovoracaceae bacterium]|jgi:hypothetical protein|nr:hypothetical protein [Bacteriovoracaceae bacterium]